MQKSYRIVSLRGGEDITLDNYVSLLLQFRTDIKLYHWQTKSFAYHKISDELLGSIDDLTDKLVEAICGAIGTRPEMKGQTITINNITEKSEIISKIKFVGTELRKQSTLMGYSEIANIRDELLGSIDKALYLLSFD